MTFKAVNGFLFSNYHHPFRFSTIKAFNLKISRNKLIFVVFFLTNYVTRNKKYVHGIKLPTVLKSTVIYCNFSCN